LAATANDDRRLAAVATAALRQSLAGAPSLIASDRLDWYHGSSGVAWALVDGGHALDSAELVAGGASVASATVRAALSRSPTTRDPSLLRGECGTAAGLMSLTRSVSEEPAMEAVLTVSRRIIESVPQHPADASAGNGVLSSGLATGLSGIGLVLSVIAAVSGDDACRSAADRALAAERLYLEPGVGWLSHDTHPWRYEAGAPSPSWCRGAAGIGIARIVANAYRSDLALLAEATAAIELVRRQFLAGAQTDASLCHGQAGLVELLLTAGSLLGEPVHTAAARRAGEAILAAPRAGERYGTGIATDAHNPSLLFGLAGTAATLARLHDPTLLPTVACPPAVSGDP
jgi:lantibiotic modifying enzyme